MAATYALKIDRAFFVLLIGVVTAVTGVAEALLPYYFNGPQGELSVLVGFIGTISNLVVIYLTTEEAELPPSGTKGEA